MRRIQYTVYSVLCSPGVGSASIRNGRALDLGGAAGHPGPLHLAALGAPGEAAARLREQLVVLAQLRAAGREAVARRAQRRALALDLVQPQLGGGRRGVRPGELGLDDGLPRNWHKE